MWWNSCEQEVHPCDLLEGRRWRPDCGQMAEETLSGALLKKTISTQASLIFLHLGQKENVFTFGGVNSSISGEELKNAVGVGDVFDNRYPEREALFICMLGSLSIKHVPPFLSLPSCPSSSPALRKINSVIMILVGRILFKAI